MPYRPLLVLGSGNVRGSQLATGDDGGVDSFLPTVESDLRYFRCFSTSVGPLEVGVSRFGIEKLSSERRIP